MASETRDTPGAGLPHVPVIGTARRWENPVAGRYYEARVVCDLFGQWQMVRVWGGIGSARGTVRFELLPAPAASAEALAGIDKRRLQRGYTLRP